MSDAKKLTRKKSWAAANAAGIVIALLATLPATAASLVDLAEQRDSAGVLKELNRVNVNEASANGSTALHWAAYWGDEKLVAALLKAGADVNAQEKRRGQTALMWAASKGHTDVVRQLTAHGADVNVHEQANERPAGRVVQAGGGTMPAGGLTALLYAAREGQRDAVTGLLNAGAEINQKDLEGWTPLLLAIVNTHYSLAADLVARGADIELPNERGLRPLYAAVEMRLPDITSRPLRPERDSMSSLDLVAVLLKAGVDPNGRIPAPKAAAGPGGGGAAFGVGAGGTAFMRAARGGDLDAMRLLMQNGADATLTRDDQTNAIMIAAGIGRPGFGATPQTRPVGDLKAALDLCRQAGVDINALNSEGNSALHGAASAGDLVMLRVLVESGIRTDLTNKEGLTALDVADGKGAGTRGRKPTPQPEAAAALRTLLGMDVKVAGT